MARAHKYLFPVIGLISIAASALIVKPFIVPVITGALIAFIFHPVYSRIKLKVKYPTLAAVIVSILIILMITIPAVIVVNTLSREAYIIYIRGKELLVTGDLLSSCKTEICANLRSLFGIQKVQQSIQSSLAAATDYLRANATNFFLAVPRKAIEVFVVIFSAFYFLRDGKRFVEYIKRLSARNAKMEYLLKRFNQVLRAVLYGSLVVALIQGALGAIAFAVLGVSSPITWGIVMFFLAMMPYFGTGLVWGPAGLIMIGNGIFIGDYLLLSKGIAMLVFGALVISTIDNILKPRLIGDAAAVHPLLVLVGIFGGIIILGAAGVIIGPAILAMALAVVHIWAKGT